MSGNAVVGGHYGAPLGEPPGGGGGPPGGPSGGGGGGGGMDRGAVNAAVAMARPQGNIEDILQQIMNITDQSLDEAQASVAL
ncbi:PBC domain [Tyrophagus putrescentiae]|nr:PBC domain [Tyrophagus putrescentiae]